MKENIYSKSIRALTTFTLVTAGSGCVKSASTPDLQATIDAQSTRLAMSTATPDYQSTIDSLNAQLATQTEMPIASVTGEATEKATEAPKQVIEETVWHADTNMEGYQASPIGGLGTTSDIIVETWGPTLAGNRGFVVVVPAGSIMWLQRHYGGTGWSVNQLSSGMTVEDLANVHADNILKRDGTRPDVVVLPGTEETWPKGGFPLLGCLQTKPVEKNVRHCDPVGGLKGYDAPAAEAEPRYFPGYK